MDFDNQKENYYKKLFVQFEIVKQLKKKELAFLDLKEKIRNVRNMLCLNVDVLRKHFEAWNFYKGNRYNMYFSLGYVPHIPIFSYNTKLRTKSDEYKEFNDNWDNNLIGFDFALDIDAKIIGESWRQAKVIKKQIFDKYKVPYSVKFSGKKGFHFLVEYKYLPQRYKITNLVKVLTDVAYNIAGIYKLEAIDYSIMDTRRVLKIAYSFDDGLICLPLSDKEFNNFHVGDMAVSNVLKNVMIKNRGLLTRTWNLNEKQLRRNTETFIKDFT